MADVPISVVIGSGADDRASSGRIAVRRVEEGVDGEMLVLSAWKDYSLGTEPLVLNVTVGEMYESRELEPRGRTRFWVAPSSATNYADLEDVIPVYPGVEPLGDTIVNNVVSNPDSASYATLEQFVIDHPGPQGATGPTGAPGGSDASFASFVTTTGTATEAAVTAKIVSAVRRLDVRNFLLEGETLPNNGVLDATALLTRAANGAAADPYAAFGMPVQVFCPPGDYKFTSSIPVKTKVGWAGAGWSTRFLPYGSAVFQYGNIVADGGVNNAGNLWMEDNQYADFWIDCSNQSNTVAGVPTYTTGIKGMWVQNMRRPRFARVKMTNSWATNLGCDFVVDGLAEDCVFTGGGRGGPSVITGTGANVGIGSGRTADEMFVFRNCTLSGSASGNVFVEWLQARGATIKTKTAQFINCTLDDSPVSVNDAGADGLTFTDCTFRYRNAGFLIRSAGQSPYAGSNGRIIRPRFECISTPVGFEPSDQSAIRFDIGTEGGGWVIEDPEFVNCPKLGILVGGGTQFTRGGLTINISRKMNIGSSLLRMPTNTFGSVPSVTVRGVVEGWGKVTAGSAGLSISAALQELRVEVRAKGSGAVGESFVSFDSAASVVVPPRISDSTFLDLEIPVAGKQYVTSTYIKDNYALPEQALYADSFRRADGLVGTAYEGRSVATWDDVDAVSWSVVSNGARPTVVGAGTKKLVLATGISDLVVQATVNAMPSTATNQNGAGLILRYTDASNYVVLDMSSTSGYRIRKVVAGTTTVEQAIGGTCAAGDVLGAKLVGDQVKVYINGVASGPFTLAASQTATKQGLISNPNASTMVKWAGFKVYETGKFPAWAV